MKNSPISTWRMAIFSALAIATTSQFPLGPIRRIPFYRRGVCEIELGDFPAALQDLERVVGKDPRYDFQRAAGLLAHAYANTGQAEKAEALFQDVTRTSTLSETYYNYALLLASQQRFGEAREWAKRILAKKPTMPGYLKRRERPWFRKANGLLKKLPAQS